MSTRSGRLGALGPESALPTYLGAVITVIGFLAIALAWAGVAGEEEVADQIPYLAGGVGLGLALVLVGVTIISVSARRRDTAARIMQLELLRDAIAERPAEPAE